MLGALKKSVIADIKQYRTLHFSGGYAPGCIILIADITLAPVIDNNGTTNAWGSA
ncbi:hypothetical protein D3C81_2251050 [compost metagenome]